MKIRYFWLFLLVFSAFLAFSEEKVATNLFDSAKWVLITGQREVGFNWLTTRPANSWLEYRQTPTGTWQSVFYAEHGLKQANTLYHRAYVRDYEETRPLYYRFVAREVIKFQSFTATFQEEVRTEDFFLAPLVRPDGSWSALAFQDVHGENTMYEPLMKLAGEDVTLCVSNGDPCHYFNSEEEIVSKLCRPLAIFAGKGRLAAFVRGNHETRGAQARHLPDYLTIRGGRYYGAQTIGAARCLFLDSGDDREDWAWMYNGSIAFTQYMRQEEAWLKEELAGPAWQTSQWRVVFLHIPLKPDNYEDDDLAQVLLTNIAPLLAQASPRPDIVMGGHEHKYQYYDAADSRRFGLDFPLCVGDTKPLERATATRLDVAPESLALKVYRGDGTLLTNRVWRRAAAPRRSFWSWLADLF